MLNKVKRLSTHIQIIPALAEHEPVLANLLELYAHDFSEFHELELGIDGRFGYKKLPLYWSEPNRHAFLVKMDDNLAGFVLVKQGSEISGDPAAWDMAEFFVVRRYRRRGVGTEIACELWRRIPGQWELRVMESNDPARRFWRRAITAFTGEPISSVQFIRNGKRWHLFSFESK